ncbi:MAG: hypothetical protein ACJA0G_001819 [Kangiellaceae bacterium]|jgi:hypothetical protein
MNLFIESIEGGTFVAGIGELRAEKQLRDKYRNSTNFQSIREIKEQLAGQKFEKVWLKQSTPYDEMCGTHEPEEKLMMELDWS